MDQPTMAKQSVPTRGSVGFLCRFSRRCGKRTRRYRVSVLTVFSQREEHTP